MEDYPAAEAGPWWRTPAHLLDSIEQDIRRLYLDEGGADPEHQAEILLCLHLPELRGTLGE